MKKYYMMFAAVAAMATISCNKDLGQNDSIKESEKGTLIHVVVGNPDSCIDDTINDSDEIGTKVSSFVPKASSKVPKWDAEDSFQLFSFDAAKGIVTDWDKFVTAKGSTSEYNANATFIGYIPVGFTNDTGGSTFTAVVTNEFNPSYAFTYDSSNSRYTFNCNIPSEQDGTGLKYSLFGSTASTYNETEKTLSGFNFRFRSALCALTLPSGSNVVKIKITMSYENEENAGTQFLASKGDKQDLKWTHDFTFLSGGGSKTITIYNNGDILPEDTTPVYFACVRTNTGGKSGGKELGLCILTFQFTNQAGLVAEKVVTLTTKALNIVNGNNLNNFGTVTFAEGDFNAVIE